jgi:hypothetical protein
MYPEMHGQVKADFPFPGRVTGGTAGDRGGCSKLRPFDAEAFKPKSIDYATTEPDEDVE